MGTAETTWITPFAVPSGLLAESPGAMFDVDEKPTPSSTGS
jgi:hypothetical protein